MTMADKFTKASRFVLYGADTWSMSKKKPTVRDWAWGIAQNYLRSRFGLHAVSSPGLIDFLRTHVTEWITDRIGIADNAKLPDGWPVQVFKCIDEVVKARGGSVPLGDGLNVPCFKLNSRTALVLPSMWVSYVDFENPGCDFDKIKKAEPAIEDALTRKCGREYNIRVMSKPARIEVDNPNPPMIRLSDQWQQFLNGKIAGGRYALGIESKPDGDMLQVNRLSNANEFSIAYFGASGSGKTQALLSALLTVCATTSPEDLSVIVIDPKAMDFPVDGLPHLAQPVITDAEQAREMVLAVVAEMDRRKQVKDRMAASKRILLVIDELADLLQVQQGDELESGLLRLAQMGRAWGFSMFIGSQRAVNESFPRKVHAQIPARWVGRVLNSSEAQFAAGMESDANKLPGKGAAMIYEPGASAVRVQSLFVADANDKRYANYVGQYVKDVAQRWQGKRSHWLKTFVTNEQAQPQTDQSTKPAPTVATIDERLDILDTLTADQYQALLQFATVNGQLGLRKMRDLIVDNGGKRLGKDNEKALHSALLAHFGLSK